jgi:hypothetical protein
LQGLLVDGGGLARRFLSAYSLETFFVEIESEALTANLPEPKLTISAWVRLCVFTRAA